MTCVRQTDQTHEHLLILIKMYLYIYKKYYLNRQEVCKGLIASAIFVVKIMFPRTSKLNENGLRVGK